MCYNFFIVDVYGFCPKRGPTYMRTKKQMAWVGDIWKPKVQIKIMFSDDDE